MSGVDQANSPRHSPYQVIEVGSDPPLSGWRRIGYWIVRLFLALLLLIGLLAIPLVITTSITPPVDPADPLTVYLVDHGRTSSLVLSTGDGGIVLYYYADWNYYLMNNRGWTDAIAALVWPTTATLGRHPIAGPQGEEQTLQHLRSANEKVFALEVEGEKVKLLRMQLDEFFKEQNGSLIRTKAGMEFVTHPHDYTYFHNSNRVTAEWLRNLDCQVNGPAINSRWKVVTP